MAGAEQQEFLDIPGLGDVLSSADQQHLDDLKTAAHTDLVPVSSTPQDKNPEPGFWGKLLKPLSSEFSKKPKIKTNAGMRSVLDLFSTDHSAHVITAQLVGSQSDDIMQDALSVFAAALKSCGHFKVSVCQEPRSLDVTAASEKEMVKAVKSARLWMIRKKTELLVLCKPSVSGRCFSFQFLSLAAGGVADPLSVSPGLSITLPARLDASLEKVYQSVALAAAGVSRSRLRKSVLGPVLKTMLAETEGAIENLPSHVLPFEKAETGLCLALALSAEHQRLGQASTLDQRARKYAGQALSNIDEMEYPVLWAEANRIFAQTLLAKTDAVDDHYQSVISAIQSALRVYTHDDHPKKWAGLYNQLGQIYYRIGFEDGDRERLRLALGCFQNVLKVYSRAKNPNVWAEAMMSLARTAQVFGEHSRSLEAMAMAVTAYQSVLAVRDREQKPMLWAATQNNLGSALFMLGKKARSITRLEAAATAFRAALEIYENKGASRQAHVTAKNLKHVEQLLERDEPLKIQPPELPWESSGEADMTVPETVPDSAAEQTGSL